MLLRFVTADKALLKAFQTCRSLGRFSRRRVILSAIVAIKLTARALKTRRYFETFCSGCAETIQCRVTLLWAVSVSLAALKSCLDETLGRVWLIQVGTEPRRYVALTFVFSSSSAAAAAFIDEFYVDRPFRGAGVGQEALRQVCHVEAPALGVRRCFLEVSEGKTPRPLGCIGRPGFTRGDYGLMTKGY